MNQELPSLKEDILDGVEVLSNDELLNETIPKLLLCQLQHIFESSSFYKKKLSGIELPNLNEIIIFHDTLPFTSKDELLADQKDNPPFGSNICVDSTNLRRMHKTSGTSGTPLLLTLTDEDIENTYTCGARCFYASGLRPWHTVINSMNYCMWAGGYTDHGSLEAVGATVIPFGVGNSKTLIDLIIRVRPDAFHSTPSYLVKLKELLLSEYNMKPIELGLKLGLFGGEGGMQDPNYRKEIEDTWGFQAMNANYGMVDVLSMFGAECKSRDGLHFMGQNVIYPTLIDPLDKKVLPIKNNIHGELVLTNLVKKSQPIVRYRTGDIIKIIDSETCTCGRKSFRFKILGRSDDMLVIKGINVFPQSIASVVNQYMDNLTGEYMILVNRLNPIDKFILRLEVKSKHEETERIISLMEADFIKTLSIRPEIELVDEGSLSRTEDKTKRIKRIL